MAGSGASLRLLVAPGLSSWRVSSLRPPAVSEPRGHLLSPAFDLAEAIGAGVLNLVRGTGDMLYLLANTTAGLFSLRGGHRAYLFHTLIQQLYFTAAQAVWLVLLVGLAFGVMAVLPLLAFGVSDVGLQASILKVVVLQQLVPLITALIVIGRSGTAITAELGDMQANGVTDSLLAMGVEPHRFLVLPRLLGASLSVMLLTLWGSFGAIVGGGLFNAMKGYASFWNFLRACAGTTTLVDIVLTALMAFSYGVGIALVQAYYGLRARSSIEVQRFLSVAFVNSLLTCLFITVLFALVRQ
jgi:phospholipid/cholesterol/gamma-HCH transport system permease protein